MYIQYGKYQYYESSILLYTVYIHTVIWYVLYVRVKAPPRMCMKNTALGGCLEAITALSKAKYCNCLKTAECYNCLKTPPECCIFRTHKQGSALSVILYFLVIWLGAIFSSIQTAVIFSDQDISKCLTNLFLVVERTNRISLASFSNLQCHTRDQSCCFSGVMFKTFHDQTISKCLYNLPYGGFLPQRLYFSEQWLAAVIKFALILFRVFNFSCLLGSSYPVT